MREHFRDPEYQKLVRRAKVLAIIFLPLMVVLLLFLLQPAVGIPMESGPFLAGFLAFAGVAALYLFLLKRLAKQEAEYKARVGWVDKDLTATNPLFEAIVEDYKDSGLRPFLQHIRLPGWRIAECDDCNGIITAVLEHGGDDLIIDLSDGEVTLHFDEEGDERIVTRPMGTGEFSDMASLADWIRAQHRDHLRKAGPT